MGFDLVCFKGQVVVMDQVSPGQRKSLQKNILYHPMAWRTTVWYGIPVRNANAIRLAKAKRPNGYKCSAMHTCQIFIYIPSYSY